MKLIGYIKPFKYGSFTSPVFKNEDQFYFQEIGSNVEIRKFTQANIKEDDFLLLNESTELDVNTKAIFIFIDIDGSIIWGDTNDIREKLRSCLVYNSDLYVNIKIEINQLFTEIDEKNEIRKKTTILEEKMISYDVPEKMEEFGIYPYYRTIESSQDTIVKIGGKDVLMFGSNNYLGIANHPKLIEASIKALKAYGNGSSGSRFLNGTLDIHIDLEEKIAKFIGKEEALVFSTGYQTCLGGISSIPGRHDYIILDELNHASLIDAARLSFAKVLKYRHNDMDSLEKVLAKCKPERIKLIVVNGIFSFEGDLANLPEICVLANKYAASIIVDEGHGIGVIGPSGKGVSSYFGLTNQVDLILGSFSKTFGTIGGFIATNKPTIQYLKHNARTIIFSASLPPPNIACVSAGIDLLIEEPERVLRLNSNAMYARKMLKSIGFDINSAQSPIISIYIRNDFKTFEMTKELLADGIFVNAIVSPSVPSSSSCLNFTVMATHTKSQIEEAILKIEKAARKTYVFDDSKKRVYT